MRKASASGNRVAVYYRMSDDTQDKSIDRQAAEVSRYVEEKGYRVVEVCKDEGISGSEVLKRKGLQRTVALALSGQIDGVIVDDLDRYLRLDLLEMGELLGPLRRAGVWIESVSQGRFDYNSMTGRLMLGITSEAKHGQLTDNARRCLTQHLRMARDEGVPPMGKTPYGYIRVEDLDKPLDQKGKRPGKWVVDESAAEIVRSIFVWYARGETTGWISDELYRRSVPSVTGALRWRRGTIRAMLANHAYIGDRAWGKISQGKHFRLVEGKLVQGSGVRKKDCRPREEWFIATGTHPAIITDRDVWEKVQARISRATPRDVLNEQGEVVRREGESTTPSCDAGAFILSKLLVCGKCSSWMSGFVRPIGVKVPAYVCAKYMAYASKGCERCEIREQDAIDGVMQELRRLLAPDRQQFLRDELSRHLAARKSNDNLSVLRLKVKELEGRLTRYRKRLMEVAADMVSEVQESVRQCRDQVEEAKAELEKVEKDDPVRTLTETIDLASKAIWSLEEAASDGDRLALREAIRGIVSKIVVYSEEYKIVTGKTRRRPARIEVHLRKGTGLEILAQLGRLPTGNRPGLIVTISHCA